MMRRKGVGVRDVHPLGSSLMGLFVCRHMHGVYRAWSSRNILRRYARVEWKFLVLVDEIERENLFTGGVFNIV